MPVSLEEILAEMSPERRAKILKRAEAMEAEINLRELRRLRKLTQAKLSRKLKIGQEGISRIEKRTDLYLSTLRSYVEGVGGRLSLVVEFPDQPAVVLAGLGEPEPRPAPESPKKARIGAQSQGKSKPKSTAKVLHSA
jgi:DNA-binding XRE family transcriptional regulator